MSYGFCKAGLNSVEWIYLGELLFHPRGPVAPNHGTVRKLDNFSVVGVIDCHNNVALSSN